VKGFDDGVNNFYSKNIEWSSFAVHSAGRMVKKLLVDALFCVTKAANIRAHLAGRAFGCKYVYAQILKTTCNDTGATPTPEELFIYKAVKNLHD